MCGGPRQSEQPDGRRAGNHRRESITSAKLYLDGTSVIACHSLQQVIFPVNELTIKSFENITEPELKHFKQSTYFQ